MTRSSLLALVVKIVLLAFIDAVAVYAAFFVLLQGNLVATVAILVVTALINVVYLARRRFLPAKYLTPGLLFLAVFQIFVLLYTGYVGFTNYGTGHNGSKEQAVSSLLASSLVRVEDSPTYPVTVVDRLGQLGLLITDPEDDTAYVGTADEPLTEVDAEFENGKAVSTAGWTSLTFQQVIARTAEITELAVPFSDDPNDGALRTPDGSSAYRYLSTLEYDESAGTMTDDRGVVYSDIGTGAFVAENGEELRPGWQITVGGDNFVRALTESSIRGPLLYVTAWTFAFAIGSVVLCFALGLLLALTFEHARMRGVRYYRLLMILPYAFPAFLSILVWGGMMNESFGFLNQVVFGGADIPWLSDPTLAKVSVLLVNLWLGFPYMFLICTGALQAIPGELTEAARVDGARGWNLFRHIKLPLLLSTTAPVLIASFAFNFNNFNLVYLLNNGGPRDTTTSLPVGHTDLLISMVYKVAFTGQNRDYGLASAFSILIFVIVAGIAIFSFSRTRALEDIQR
ncbi:ABC transporter permease subunit [Pseudolysinimonas yzui]|uniref:Maltose/maltodextrin transport system permease protein n=1 Tax=Pseudolysinimonas yzui TaxID=2708254 RepID=A0A8J3GPW6_9MICO|nr:ABC transporter permease subunit [Pseudolysinimonas yzui]GHF13725.1 sugar ABC transporter permease [Pseudolysinimonas yzui]